ncbi:GlxA family transcriptional regulator [Vibrio superstes]|uniref:AraC family transcriptional regulator n=1 Tax=Vibrio superstes NBRC 103154 TaxID=1219062 RepID=A0A511QTF4_9VIBR|nr:helix-turn-helix domain-containing protein [Vibrio superstes]GEM80648.1 AraC family transcriptional regulator [Vibrio superstes NBRC 103154]
MNKHTIAIVAVDNISAFHVSVPCLVFQDVFIQQQSMFDLCLCSENAADVSLSSGFTISIEKDLSFIDSADIVVIPSWPNALPEPSKALLDKLIEAHQRGATIVGLCLGAYVVAKTGLLDKKKATTHWAFSEKFKQDFPNVSIDCNPLFIEQGNIITSAGTAASLDCCLHIVRRLHGNEIASTIARTMVTAPFRNGGQKQYIPSPIDKRADTSVSFVLVINEIAQNLGNSYDLDSVAAQCAMSRRTFTRQFKAQYGCSFGEWLTQQRLDLSQTLLESTDYSISTVAELIGIGSDSVFRKHFKKAYHVSPTQWRAVFRANI